MAAADVKTVEILQQSSPLTNAVVPSCYCYVKVVDDGSEEAVELPSENDGSLLLTTIQAQFPGCTGLRYRADGATTWRGIRISGGILSPPPEGWGLLSFHTVYPKTADISSKRKIAESPSHKEPEAKIVKTYGSQEEAVGDLIVLGLPFSADENDVRSYFQQFGEVALAEVKRNPSTNKSKGFGFVSFKSNTVAKEVLAASHAIGGRRCEVRVPRQKEETAVAYKVFVGRLAEETNEQDLKNYFTSFGELADVYIPKPFRGFGFVTFVNSDSVKELMHGVHTIKGSRVNITFAEPKGKKESPNFQNMMHMFGNMSSRAGMNMFSPFYNQGHPPEAMSSTQGSQVPHVNAMQSPVYGRSAQQKYSWSSNLAENTTGNEYATHYNASGVQPPSSSAPWS